MAISPSALCLFLAATWHLSTATQLLSSAVAKHQAGQMPLGQESLNFSTAPKLQLLTSVTQHGAGQFPTPPLGPLPQALLRAIPFVSPHPHPDLFEEGFSYSEPIGAGCTDRPAWTMLASPFAPAKAFNTDGWMGFCQMGWPLCPDARRNKDYSYYAKGLGPSWVRLAGQVDKEYCGKNGFLKPEVASIVHNFTALQAKGEELCSTKFAIPFRDTAPTWGVALINALRMDEHDAAQAAAWNCGLGDLACDMAYCNYAYCEQSDGSFGIMDECEGWDKVHGMPSARAA